MTSELNQVIVASGIFTLTSLILMPILLWVLTDRWRNFHLPE